MPWWSFLRRYKGPPRVSVVVEPLGEMQFDEELERWVAIRRFGEQDVAFHAGGDSVPDPVLVANVWQILADQPAFSSSIASLLQATARALPGLEAEILGLRLDSVVFGWPRTPHYAMVDFDGGDEGRIWHCNLEHGKLGPLGFDD